MIDSASICAGRPGGERGARTDQGENRALTTGGLLSGSIAVYPAVVRPTRVVVGEGERRMSAEPAA
jgi:hypothetical protein